MDKKNWYFENTVTGQISSDPWDAECWADFDGVDVDCWHWSETCQEWLVWMTREGDKNGYRRWAENFFTGM